MHRGDGGRVRARGAGVVVCLTQEDASFEIAQRKRGSNDGLITPPPNIAVPPSHPFRQDHRRNA